MKTLNSVLAAFFILVLTSSGAEIKNIKLIVFNNTKQKCTIKIYQQPIPSETAEKTFVTQKSVDTLSSPAFSAEIILPAVKAGNYLNIYAELEKGGRTASSYVHITKKTKEVRVPVDVPEGKSLSGASFQAIKDGMKYEPEKFMIVENYPLSDLFNGLFGGLIIYRADSAPLTLPTSGTGQAQMGGNAHSHPSIKNIITPVQLGTRIDAKFGQNSDRKTVVISKDQSMGAKLAIPSIAGLSLDWSSADLFKLEIVYKGAGPILWTPTQEMEDVTVKFKKLAKDRLELIGQLYDQDTTLKMAQVDNAYVYEAISFDLIRFTQLTSNTQVNGSVYFTANGNFAASTEETQKLVIGSFVLGAWWQNDYSPLLHYARKVYLEAKERQIAEKNNQEEIKNIYNSLRETNPDLPEYSTKAKAIAEIKKLKKNVKVNEDEIIKNPETIPVEQPGMTPDGGH